MLQFFILDKTDYSEHDRDAFLNIFVKRKSNPTLLINYSKTKRIAKVFFVVLSWLKEDSISVKPVWKMNECNGWTVTINLKALSNSVYLRKTKAMTTEQIEALFNTAVEEKAIYNELKRISEDKNTIGAGRGAKPSIGDMLNVLYQLKN
jgi:hypothetical protein